MEKGFRYELALIISATPNCVIKLIKRIRSVHEGSNALCFGFSFFITSSSCTERKEKWETQQDNSEWVFWLTFQMDRSKPEEKAVPQLRVFSHALAVRFIPQKRTSQIYLMSLKLTKKSTFSRYCNLSYQMRLQFCHW